MNGDLGVPPKTAITRPAWTALFAAFCLLPTLGFVVYHVLAPSDGARLSREIDIFTDRGAIVSPYLPQVGGLQEGDVVTAVGGLQEGDVVTAVAGVSMETWARALYTGEVDRPAWVVGETVTYRVLRAAEETELTVRLQPLPVMAIVRDHWGAMFFALVSQLVAGFVYLRRREDPAARALLIWALSGSHTYAWSFFLQIGDIVGGAGFWLFRLATPLLWLLYWPATLHVALVFPKPLPLVTQRRWLIPFVYLGSFLIFGVSLTWVWFQSLNILLWLNSWGPIDSLIAAIYLAGMLIVIAIQYRRRGRGIERQQMRWAVYGAAVSGGGGLLLWIAAPLVLGRSVISANVLGLLALPFPISLAIAIWRYRLFEIDLIIRRTLSYALLTGLLGAIYFGGVVGLQALFARVAGREDSPLITVLTTLAIAALFNPLRTRVQDFIDQRFYRAQYNAEQALAQFAATARDEVDMERLTDALLSVVEETMQPERASIWIKRRPK